MCWYVLPIFVGNHTQTYRSSFANPVQEQFSVVLYPISSLFAIIFSLCPLAPRRNQLHNGPSNSHHRGVKHPGRDLCLTTTVKLRHVPTSSRLSGNMSMLNLAPTRSTPAKTARDGIHREELILLLPHSRSSRSHRPAPMAELFPLDVPFCLSEFQHMRCIAVTGLIWAIMGEIKGNK